jgi:hypothetical protein
VRGISREYFFHPWPVFVVAILEAAFGKKFFIHSVIFLSLNCARY